MQWINRFIKGSFSLYQGNVVEAFQPLDFFHFYPLWYDLWITEICKVMDKLDLDNKSYQEIKHLLPTTSNLIAIPQKVVPCWRGYPVKKPEEVKRVINFVARMLIEARPEDPFGETKNPCLNEQEVLEVIEKTPWKDADTQIAKNLGRLIAAAGSLVHGFYNDVVTDYGWDTYGQFDVEVNGEKRQLMIRHFPDMQPDLWPKEFLTSVKEIKIYQLYNGVQWRIGCVGCHTMVVSGNPIEGLEKFALEVDGKFVDADVAQTLIAEFAQKAETIYREIRKMDFEELKKKVILQECYQLNKLFTEAGMDWHPTPEMYERVKGKELITGIVPKGKMMTTIDEYVKSFGVDVFAKEVLGETI